MSNLALQIECMTEFCLCCQKSQPVVNDELCPECSIAMTYCANAGIPGGSIFDNKVGHCPLCPPGDWVTLYWSSYADTREEEFCLTHAVFVTRCKREMRKPDFSHIGDVRNVA